MALLPFDDRDGFIWYDGGMLPWREAKLHVLSHGLHYASCAFEGERVYEGKVFKLTQHSARLIDSCRILDIELPYSVEAIDAATREVVSANQIRNGYVRPIAWRGAEVMGVSAKGTKPHVAIAAWPWPEYYSEDARRKGLRVTVSKWRRPAPDTAPTGSKAAGLYMICTLSRHQAEAAGFDDALMWDYRGQVAEATGANLFAVFGSELHTPIPDCFLNGITRQTTIELARQRGIPVVERAIWPDELMKANEIFLTGTAVEIIPIREIDGKTFPVGPITLTLMDDYSKLVRS